MINVFFIVQKKTSFFFMYSCRTDEKTYPKIIFTIKNRIYTVLKIKQKKLF